MVAADPSIEPLFDAVYLAPRDDTRKQVLADALQERGDPRGEFISLSLLDRPGVRATRRMDKLLARHRTEFLGPLSTAVHPGERWERGFVTTATVSLDGTLGSIHAWATLIQLTVASDAPPAELASPWFSSLTEVRGLPAAGVDVVFAASRPLPFTTVALRDLADLSSWSPALVDRVGLATTLPRLERLGLRSATPHLHEVDWLWELPVAARLKALEVKGSFVVVPVQAILDRVRRATVPVDTLIIHGSAVSIRTRRARGYTDLEFSVTRHGAAGTLGAVARMLDGLDPSTLASLSVSTERPVGRDVLRVLRSAARRFNRHTAVTLPGE